MAGKTNNPCTLCGFPGIPGMTRGAGKCQYHYNLGQFGTRGLAPFTFGDWHAWQGTGQQVMLSDESIKKLRSFPSVDDAVNWLFTNGHQDAGRALNKHANG